MKKTIFSFAIAAIAAVAMVSCGNKTEQKAENEPEATEQQAPEQKDAQEITEGPGTVENAVFSVDVPEGWKVMLNNDKKIIIGVSDVQEKLCIEKYSMAYDSKVEQQKAIKDCEDLGEQTYGSNKFATFKWMGKFYAFLNTNGNAGYIGIDGSNIEADNETLQKVLASIKVK